MLGRAWGKAFSVAGDRVGLGEKMKRGRFDLENCLCFDIRFGVEAGNGFGTGVWGVAEGERFGAALLG